MIMSFYHQFVFLSDLLLLYMAALEKSRLAQRVEGFQRWQDPGAVVEASSDGLGFVSHAALCDAVQKKS
jgi:hypothetical protein